MEPLITQPTSTPPAPSKKKYLIGGGVLALVLVGVIAYSMMSPADIYKGAAGAAPKSCVMADEKTPGIEDAKGNCVSATPEQTPQEICEANDPVTHGWRMIGGACRDVKKLCVATPDPVTGEMVNFEWKELSPGNFDCREVVAATPKASGIIDDNTCASGKRNPLNVAGAPGSCVPPTKADCQAKVPPQDLNEAGTTCIDRVVAEPIAVDEPVISPLDKTVEKCMAQTGGNKTLCEAKIVKATEEDAKITPEVVATAVEKSKTCGANQEYNAETESCKTTLTVESCLASGEGNTVKDNKCSWSDREARLKWECENQKQSFGHFGLYVKNECVDPKSVVPAKITCPSGLVPQTNGTCKAKSEPIPAKATPVEVAVVEPAQTVINNYYSSGYVDNSLDQATLDRIAALEAQIAAANQPAAAGEVLVQADPGALTQLQIELSNLQNVVKKARAKNSQLATAEGAAIPSQTGIKPAANSTTQTAATARNTNGLHGAAIRGESGPGILIYPALVGLAQGAYVLVKRRRK